MNLILKSVFNNIVFRTFLTSKNFYKSNFIMNNYDDTYIEEELIDNIDILLNNVENMMGFSSIVTLSMNSLGSFNNQNIPGRDLTPKAYNWSSKTILIVEDEESNYLFLDYALRKTNVKILRAFDGKEAIEICKADNGIDLVLMDIQLPILSGFEATLEIKKNRTDLPVIAQTAYAMSTDRDKCIEVGCDDFIAKPINKFILLETIDRFFQ